MWILNLCFVLGSWWIKDKKRHHSKRIKQPDFIQGKKAAVTRIFILHLRKSWEDEIIIKGNSVSDKADRKPTLSTTTFDLWTTTSFFMISLLGLVPIYRTERSNMTRTCLQ